MKAEQLISRYLASNRQVTLQEIGTLFFNGNADTSGDINKTPHFIEDSITFEFNKNAKEDSSFIDYLSEKTGKKRSLIASDLESFILTGKQFLNIGKPLIIKDVGILLKNQQGVYEFTQGSNTHEPIDISNPKANNGGGNPDEIDFSTAPKKKKNINKSILIGIVAVIVLFAIVLINNFMSNNQKNNPINALDSSQHSTIDSTKSSIKQTSVIDSNQFMLIKVCSNLKEAQTIQSMYLGKGFDIQIKSIDSLQCSVNFLIQRKLSDSAMIKDSLQKSMQLQLTVETITKP